MNPTLAMENGRALTPDLEALAEDLAGAPADRVLVEAVRALPGRVALATGFGAEGCVLVERVATLGLPVEILTLDTGYFFPETLALWARLEARYGVTIRAVRPELTVSEQDALHGPRLHERDPDLCCHLRKVVPLTRALAPYAGWITALRRDQAPSRAHAREIEWDTRHGLVKVNPLARWTADEVWAHVRRHEVPTNPLHEAGYPSIGCAPCTSPVAPGEHARAGRWRGREKTECGIHPSHPARRLQVIQGGGG